MKAYDVVIAGGGVVGRALAVALDKTKLFTKRSIALIDPVAQRSPLKRNATFSNRVSFITPAATSLFQGLGVWDELADRAWPVRDLHIIDADVEPSMKIDSIAAHAYQAFASFSATEADRSSMGYIVENDLMESCLSEHISLCDSIDHLTSCKLKEIIGTDKADSSSSILTVEQDGRQENPIVLQAELLVGADGVNSTVRRLLNMHHEHINYDQIGLVATLEIGSASGETPPYPFSAWQRFLSTGPIAYLPLYHDTASLVWSVPSEWSSSVQALTDEELACAINLGMTSSFSELLYFLNNTSPTRCGEILEKADGHRMAGPPRVLKVKENSRACFHLRTGITTPSYRNNAILIGDAAHYVHPMAGQGLNLGLYDVTALCALLKEKLPLGSSLGDPFLIREYASRRDMSNFAMVMGIDALFRLYCTNSAVWRPSSKLSVAALAKEASHGNHAPSFLTKMRRIGMQVVDRFHPLKSVILARAMGY